MAPSAGTHSTKPCYVVAVPYPGRGHVNPMMILCKLLTNRKPHLLITFVVTEEWLGFMSSEEKPDNIQFATIPNVLPSEMHRAADMPSFVGATQTKMGEPFERLLDRLGATVNIIIADTFLNWAVEVGNRRNIPVVRFGRCRLRCSPSFTILTSSFRKVITRLSYLAEKGEERVDYIPGIASIRLADIPSIAHMKDQRLLDLALRIFPNVCKAQYLLFTSISDLELNVIDALKQEFAFPVYTFGPAIPYFNLEKATSFSTNQDDHDNYFNWLNSQPSNSVLYVSLGSFLSVSSAQMDEIADGLRESGVKFLWVARGESERLKEKCGYLGRVVPWCEQLKVLCHPSVGGFWTHCGWNSTMECIFAGVPIIAFPIIMDQTTIRKHIVEDWKIGVDAKRGVGSGDLLRSREIARLVKSFMDLESVERKEIARRARVLQDTTRGAISDGGTSKTNLDSFLNDIVSFK